MNRQYIVAAVVAIGLIGSVGVGSAIAGVGPAADLLDEEEQELLSFESAGTHCTESFMTNSSTTIENGPEDTTITHAQNISLPDSSYTVGTPSFEAVNESTYLLSVPTEEVTEKEPKGCTGVARYEASMQIPVGDDPWTIVVEHDNETAMTLYGDSNSTGASGSASAGTKVSDK